ncbi:MAG: hypothetical protein RIR00_1112 [Pseudomonadota bacterium]
METANVLAAADAPHIDNLRRIGTAIGYGRAIQLLGEAWGEMLERKYGLPRQHGEIKRRLDIEHIEGVIRDSTKDQAAMLRAALVGLVGADDEDELRQMEAALRLLPAPDSDKAVTINAIHALLATWG